MNYVNLYAYTSESSECYCTVHNVGNPSSFLHAPNVARNATDGGTGQHFFVTEITNPST